MPEEESIEGLVDTFAQKILENPDLYGIIRKIFLKSMKEWAEGPKADELFMSSSSGDYTPRMIYEIVEKDKEESREFLETFICGSLDYHLYKTREGK